MRSGPYVLMTVAAPDVQKTCDKSAPICKHRIQSHGNYQTKQKSAQLRAGLTQHQPVICRYVQSDMLKEEKMPQVAIGQQVA